MIPLPRHVRVGLWLAAVVVGVALVVTVGGAIINIHLRPMDGVEGDAIFEASRLRAGLALYVDPAVGAHDYGAIPARYYVLYPPLWPWLLAHLPPSVTREAARAIGALAWWGLLAWIAVRAKPACRTAAIAAAAFVGGVYALAEFGGSARPDSLALLASGVALVRCFERGKVDAVAGALFALAAWTKPNVVGMACGALIATALRERLRAWPGIAAAALTSLALGALVHVASRGTWVEHLLMGTGQPLRPDLFLHHLRRMQFFGAPLAFAFACGWRVRTTATGQLALAALGASLPWSLFTFAKMGSAANYWMEPCVAAVALLAHAPMPSLSALSPRTLAFAAIGLPLQALWTDVASVRATFEAVTANRLHSELLARARNVCGAEPGQLVVADEPGIELMLDGGRIVAHAFPLTHAALRGKLPLGPWIADLKRPEIACVVTAHDRIERPLWEVDVDYDYFAPAVRAVLAERFAPALESGGWEVYAPRRRPD